MRQSIIKQELIKGTQNTAFCDRMESTSEEPRNKVQYFVGLVGWGGGGEGRGPDPASRGLLGP
jgi:hypothetical protein